MSNNRQAGKRWERWFVSYLRPIFPNIRRNAGTQSQSGGRDLENTPGFSIEVKGGKSYKSRMIRKILDQAESQRKKGSIVIALVKPLREEAYGIVPFDDLLKLIKSRD